MPFSQKTSVFLLSFIELLERFSYYGMRTLLVFFAIDKLGMENQEAIAIYGWLAIFIFIEVLRDTERRLVTTASSNVWDNIGSQI